MKGVLDLLHQDDVKPATVSQIEAAAPGHDPSIALIAKA